MERYVFVLCLIVFITLTVLFTVMLAFILRLTLKGIRSGVEDENILDEYEKRGYGKKKTCFAEKIFTAFFVAVLFFVFGYAVYLQANQNTVNTIPVYRVVYSDSMSKKHKNNGYLTKNGLNDQFNKFDLIRTEKLPKESELKLYDVVVYELDDMLIVHRIVKIEEPNEQHPTSRLFITQGDNVKTPDLPVEYSQMRAIYRGKRIPHVGSFIVFLQAPVGYLCIILCALCIVYVPIFEKKIEREEKKRLNRLLEDKNRWFFTVPLQPTYFTALPVQSLGVADESIYYPTSVQTYASPSADVGEEAFFLDQSAEEWAREEYIKTLTDKWLDMAENPPMHGFEDENTKGSKKSLLRREK